MRLPLIIQFRREVSARRQSILFDRHPSLILLIAFAGPLLVMVGFGTYRAMQQYVARDLPVVPLFSAALAVWIGIGLSRQFRLNRDRKWNSFIRCMPIRPIHFLALRAYIGISVGIIGAVLLICGLCGAGTEFWTMTATFKWLIMGTAFVWVLSLQSFLGMIGSRFSRGQRFLLLALALWGIVFLGSFAWNLRSGNPYSYSFRDACLTDPVLVASGMTSLMCTLIPQDLSFPVTGFWAVLHLAAVSTALAALSWRFVRQPLVNIPARPKDLFVTVPLRRVISRTVPDSRGGQMSIELLRMLRGPHLRLLFYVTISVIAGIGLQIAYPAGNHHVFLLVVFALFAVNERADLLQIRQADFLYLLHGVDARDYLLGLTTSVGLLVSVLCLIQVPLFRNCDIQTYSRMICICIAIALSSTGMNVAFDHYSRQTKFFRYLIMFMLFLAVISKAWAMIPLVVLLSFSMIRLPCLIYSLILFSISFTAHGCLPLLIAGIIIVSEIIRTPPDAVKKWYWKISE